jgi:AcrR family transcriptional regulator
VTIAPAPPARRTDTRSGTPIDADADAKRRPGRPRDEKVSSAITDAALRQLAELGYANVTMESVATEAGVARATVYRRYRDKADLITAAIADNSDAHRRTRADADPRAALVAYLTEFDERFAEPCLEVVGTLIGVHGDPVGMSLHRERVVVPRMGYVRELLEDARRQGLLGPDADVDLAVQMLSGSVFARRIAGMDSSPRWAERAVDTVLSGMGGAPAAAPTRRSRGGARRQ